ncbi:MAG: RNA polymerase sigma factor [Pirellula sp.]|jgi:RNA polymerase sigma-70 factor (ECF subfamily)|nr:RNA polymerase sigma factor [Pirellula sp.]
MSELALRYSMEESVMTIDWAKALDSHRRWLETVISSRLSDRQAAEDVLQEVALAAISQRSRPVDPEKVAPWLYRIALRKVINHHRVTGRRRRLIEGVVAKGPGPEELVAPAPGEWLMKEENDKAVQRAMSQLRPQDRQLLLLKYTEGWGYQDISEHLGISIKTVEYRLLKARRALRAKLTDFH